MANDERDNPGVRIPPPLIYLAPLVLGLLLDRRRYISFLPPAWHASWGGYFSLRVYCSRVGFAGRCGRPMRRYVPIRQ